MTEYVLAKDLPFAKAGTRVFDVIRANFVEFSPTQNVYIDGKDNSEIKLGILGDLIKDGWITEAEPYQNKKLS